MTWGQFYEVVKPGIAPAIVGVLLLHYGDYLKRRRAAKRIKAVPSGAPVEPNPATSFFNKPLRKGASNFIYFAGSLIIFVFIAGTAHDMALDLKFPPPWVSHLIGWTAGIIFFHVAILCIPFVGPPPLGAPVAEDGIMDLPASKPSQRAVAIVGAMLMYGAAFGLFAYVMYS